MKYSLLVLLIVPFILLSQSQYVDPTIGTGGTGHTFPGVVVPFGMVQLSPDTRNDATWEGTSGYHYSDTILYGFSHTHLSGTGVSDWGDLLLVPQSGALKLVPEQYALRFQHEKESVEAGYYSVELEDIKVGLTASKRVGVHRYTFNQTDDKRLLLDFNHRDEVIDAEFKMVSDTLCVGYRRSSGWASDQWVFFAMQFSKPVKTQVFHDKVMMAEADQLKYKTFRNKDLIAAFEWTGEDIEVKTAISFTDREGALKNLSEVKNKNFDEVKNEARRNWDKALSVIEVETPIEHLKTTFYTALYHTMIHPTLASDIDGRYRGRDDIIYTDSLNEHYTVFSLWDTYRALHPLFNLIAPSKNEAFVQSMLDMYEQSGRLPVWELSANETECMIGYHSVSVIADAFVKGMRSFDHEQALSAMIHSAETDLSGLPFYREKGYLEMGDEHESVSKTLEYAYDDWCIAQMAKYTGREEIAEEFFLRSKSWRNLFNTKSGFIQPRSNGGWYPEFYPERVDLNYTEANGWQYNFSVPHDILGMISAYGGTENLENKLDTFFKADSKTFGLNHPDITGMIGQYAHGNEPSHHYAMLYNHIGKPYKTQKILRKIMNEFYTNQPDGLIGNDDCGQMSAWYVFNAMGFYPTLPGTPYYDIGSPLFEKVTIHLENGNDLVINATNAGSDYPYIMDNDQWVFDHHILNRGGVYNFNMSDEPQIINDFDHPGFSKVQNVGFIPTPVFTKTKEIFKDTVIIEIENNQTLLSKNAQIYYQINEGKEKKYEKPFVIDTSCQILAYSKLHDLKSNLAKAQYFKLPNNYKIKVLNPYNTSYNAGGDIGVIDGLKGDENWKKGRWQGYQNTDFVVEIDLRRRMKLDSVSVRFLQDTRSWILMPTELVVEIQKKKGKPFKEVTVLMPQTSPQNYEVLIEELTAESIRGKIRAIKITAKNFGKLPEWHQGFPYDGDAFIFVDEVSIFPSEQ